MLTPYDDYPLHQVPLPLAHAGEGHPDFYDRFWFNGYTEDTYFAVAMGFYPNRGIIDAAFSTVCGGEQRSVFVSGRIPTDRTRTELGPIRIEILEPLRRNRIVVDAPEQGLQADLTFTARTAAFEEPRQTRYRDNRLWMDVTRATSLGSWEGVLRIDGTDVPVSAAQTRGTKDRSWGVRAIGDPTPRAPEPGGPQLFFLWAPLNFQDECLHYMRFEDAAGDPWSSAGAVLPVLGEHESVTPERSAAVQLPDIRHTIDWAPGLRRSRAVALDFTDPRTGRPERVELEPLLTFRMRGAGYGHPRFKHGTWHGELVVDGEVHRTDELDNLDPANLHVQQLVRARWGERVGLGVLEQYVLGPHAPTGVTALNDPPLAP